jgi:hypothetical protein
MAWLNEPVEIIEDYRVYKEKQTYLLEGSPTYRTRIVTVIVYNYVGCDYDGATAKANVLKEDSSYTDIQVAPAGGGQYHCRATKTTEGDWSAWITD